MWTTKVQRMQISSSVLVLVHTLGPFTRPFQIKVLPVENFERTDSSISGFHHWWLVLLSFVALRPLSMLFSPSVSTPEWRRTMCGSHILLSRLAVRTEGRKRREDLCLWLAGWPIINGENHWLVGIGTLVLCALCCPPIHLSFLIHPTPILAYVCFVFGFFFSVFFQYLFGEKAHQQPPYTKQQSFV